jgi:hypothetical protein
MDCISMVPVQPARAWSVSDQDAARARHYARRERLQRAIAPRPVQSRAATVAAAIARAQQRRGATNQ